MWMLVSVVKGSRHFENESPVGNKILISDNSDMVISGRADGNEIYRFEIRRGNETFIVNEFRGVLNPALLASRFQSMARQLGAVIVTTEAVA
ncbi:MAG: hypothetical protein ACKVQR_08010 [Aquabacterium sp.]